MAFIRGRCTNFDYCTLAETRRDIEVPEGVAFTCPECRKPLKVFSAKEAEAAGGLRVGLIACVALVLVGGGLLAGYLVLGPRTGPAPSAASVAVVAPPPVAPPAPEAPAAQTVTAAPAVAAPPTPPAAASTTPQAETVLLRLRGSALIAGQLAPRLAAAYLTQSGDTGVASQPGGAREMRVFGMHGDRREVISVTGSATVDGFMALASGQADIGMADRRIGAAEQAGFAAVGGVAAKIGEQLIARDAAAAIVNPSSGLTSLTKDQLRGVFSGALRDWSQIGGARGDIHVYAGPALTDAAGLFMDAAPVMASAKLLADDAAVAQAVVADASGVGLVELPNLGGGRVLALAEIGAQPVSAAPETIASGDYPLAQSLYLYTIAAPNASVAPFLAFAASPAGQQVVRQLGLISADQAAAAGPLPGVASAPQGPLSASDRYKQLVAGTTQLSTDMRFKRGSNDLDARSLRDMDRVWNMMMSDHTSPDHLVLLGFADNQGTPAANLAISQKRAEAVAAVFAQRGLTPGQIVAFGSALPIADNSTEAGREKNRRVEVYLRP